ncbi:MAG: NAD(P)-dependent oxidoreductase, partial [Acidimicrobiales bacterium]
MRVIIFGATGKTGRLVVRRALDEGHRVTAFGRSVDSLAEDEPEIDIHKGDVFDHDSVAEATTGHDAVIVCLGSTGLRDRDTLSAGTANVVDAMVDRSVERLIVLSAAGVGESWRQIPRSSRLAFRTILR